MNRLALPLAGVAWVLAAPAYGHCGKCPPDAKEAVKQMETGKLTAAGMVAAAEAHAKGKAVGLVVDLDKGKLDADVFVLVGDKVQAVEVDAAGKAVKMEEAKTITGMGDVTKSMDSQKVTLASIIGAAETHAKGKALAVVSKATAGKASYEVYAVAGDKIQKVTVDDHGHATGMAEAKELPAAPNEEKPKPKPGG
jgi:uncharacterized membrane protein YkoI